MAERVHGLRGVRQEFRRDQEQHARGAERQEGIAGLDDADAGGARGVVAATTRHGDGIHAPVGGDFLAQLAGRIRAFDEARHVRFVEPVAASISGDHLRLATSTQSVPAASEQSLAFSPVINRRT